MRANKGAWASLVARLGGVERDRIDAVLETVGLLEHKPRRAGALSHGQKQWLEIGMLLVQDPQLLLIDEPAAGLSDEETSTMATLIRKLAEGHTVIVIEHDMGFVRQLEADITVLNEGRILAEGPMSAVQADQRVIEAYLGR